MEFVQYLIKIPQIVHLRKLEEKRVEGSLFGFIRFLL